MLSNQASQGYLGISQETTVSEYRKRFEALCLDLISLPGKYLEEIFLRGLKPNLQAAVRQLQPKGIVHMMDLAQWLEEGNNIIASERVLSMRTESNWPESPRNRVSQRRKTDILVSFSAEPVCNGFTMSRLSRLHKDATCLGTSSTLRDSRLAPRVGPYLNQRPAISGYPCAIEELMSLTTMTICENCNEVGHSFKRCPSAAHPITCKECMLHQAEDCPRAKKSVPRKAATIQGKRSVYISFFRRIKGRVQPFLRSSSTLLAQQTN